MLVQFQVQPLMARGARAWSGELLKWLWWRGDDNDGRDDGSDAEHDASTAATAAES